MSNLSSKEVTPEDEVEGCYTKADRDMLEQCFKQVAWIMGRRGKVGTDWRVELDGRVYKFRVSAYTKGTK